MRLAVALVTSILLGGCLGGIDDVGGTGDGGMRGPDARVVDVKGILRTWSGCMTLTNFQTANMTTAWSTLVSSDGKTCQNCHSEGQYNFIATDDETAFYTGLSQHSYFMLKYFLVDTATEKVIVNTKSFMTANSAIGHPKFNYTMNAGMTALTSFYNATVANTACGAPTMID
jgi:hypothetical protein